MAEQPEPRLTVDASVPVDSTLLAASASSGDDSFLHEVARDDVLTEDSVAQTGDFIAGRYYLLHAIGGGAFGVVWEADDRVARRKVAVKVLRYGGGASSARVRREILSLRVLSMPGVARLLDEGEHDGRAFLAMDIVRGLPFPGVKAPCSWEALEAPFVRLLGTLARVHALGMVHRDLKPANVLVESGGRPVVLDFGLALHAASLSSITLRGRIMGTPAFLAPEQIAGKPATARTDLYAAGLMAFLALTGWLPHNAASPMEICSRRLLEAAPRLTEIAPGVPRRAAEVIDSLLEADPARRPPSAVHVVEQLMGLGGLDSELAGLHERLQGRPGPLDARALAELFRGPDRLLHLREDAARLLHERTGGDPELAAQELTRWVEAGVAGFDGARLTVRREVLGRLADGLLQIDPTADPRSVRGHAAAAAGLPSGAPFRLFHLMQGAAELDAQTALAIGEEALAIGAQRLQDGRLGEASTALSAGLSALRAVTPAPSALRLRLLSAWAAVALSKHTPQALDHVLYELLVQAPRTPEMEHVAQLLRAALALDSWTPHTAELIAAVPPLDDPLLERRRWELVARAMHRGAPEREAEVLDRMAAWAERADDGEALAALAARRGELFYHQGRYEAAAAAHVEAAKRRTGGAERTSSLLSASSALLEAFRLEDAAELAEQARVLASMSRHPVLEARAEWLLRSITYRRGDVTPPDLELCEAATELHHPYLDGLIHATEAAAALRCGDPATAGLLAERAHRLCTGTGFRLGRLLSGGILAASGRAVAGVGELLEEARRCSTPGVGIQVLALLASGGYASGASEREIIGLAETVPRARWERCLDVMSVAEALRRLGRAHELTQEASTHEASKPVAEERGGSESR